MVPSRYGIGMNPEMPPAGTLTPAMLTQIESPPSNTNTQIEARPAPAPQATANAPGRTSPLQLALQSTTRRTSKQPAEQRTSRTAMGWQRPISDAASTPANAPARALWVLIGNTAATT